jgi:hypothetical protein
MCNFVLSAKEKLPGNKCRNGVYNDAGEELYPKWKEEFKIDDRKKIKKWQDVSSSQLAATSNLPTGQAASNKQPEVNNRKQDVSENFKDILSHLSSEIDQETLLLYLQDKLSAEKRHEVEKKLLENEFAEDAVDGLKKINDKQHISYMVEMLNRDLKKKLAKRQQQRERMRIKDQPWLYISIIIIVLLIVIAYIVIRKSLPAQ